MSRFASILLPLDGSPQAAKGAACALWLARKLDATLHVLHATAHPPLSAGEALARLRVPHVHDARVVVHQMSGGAETAVLQEIASHCIDLVVMSARGESASANVALSRRLGTIAQAVIERSPVPVVLLSMHYRESLPWTSMLAAVSGEAGADRALEAAAQLATALQLKVTVVHSEAGSLGVGAAPLGTYADALHHEYPHRLELLVERALAGCPAQDARCIHEVLLRNGDPASVLLEQIAHHHSSVLALGWHGMLGAGRAPTLKRVLEQVECALLIVRRAERSGALLKVGNQLNEH